MSETQGSGLHDELLKGAPHAKVISISSSRHLVMYDQPTNFREKLANFLANLPRN